MQSPVPASHIRSDMTPPPDLHTILATASAISQEYGSCVAIEYLQAHGMGETEIQRFFEQKKQTD